MTLPARPALAALLAILTAASAALAQFGGGVNIDFNATTGTGVGQPTILFAGAAGQTGYWNPLNTPYTTATSRIIRNLANSVDAVTLTFGGASTTAYSFNNASTSGDTELLIDDTDDIGSTGAVVTYTIGLYAPGVYEVYTYAVAPDNAAYRTSVEAGSSLTTLLPAQVVGGAIPAGGALTQGIAYAKHTVALGATGNIVIRATTTTGFGSVNGLQIKPLNTTRLYVDSATTAPDAAQDGLTWATAFANLQNGIARATILPAVNEIWVARGRHFVDSLSPGPVTVTLRNGLALRGGFAGTETTLAARGNPRDPANWTIIDGSHGTYANPADDVASCVTADGVTATLDGFLILLGTNNGLGGAGAKLTGGSVTVTNCIFDSNLGTPLLAVGGIHFIDDCTFQNGRGNGASFAVYNAAIATFDRCRFTGGDSAGNCAGVGRIDASARLYNCLLEHNTSRCGGQLEVNSGGVLFAVNCTIADNTGISANDAAVGVFGTGNCTLRNSILWGNRITGSAAPLQQQQIQIDPTAAFECNDNIIEGWDGAFGGAGIANFSADPRFALGVEPYRLASRSPARDSGYFNNLPVGHNTLDFARNPRMVDDTHLPNTGVGSSTQPIDRGCYEAQDLSLVCPADIGSQGGVAGPDGLRDNNDFIIFVEWFFGFDSRADVGRQGGVAPGEGLFDNNDFIVFIEMFFSFCP